MSVQLTIDYFETETTIKTIIFNLFFRFYSHVEEHEPVVIIIKTMDEEVTISKH